jgi:hypothetical protein
VIVTLTPSEIFQGAMVGVMRQTANIRDRRRNAHGLETQRLDWQYHIEGALGELAFAKFIGAFWSGSMGDLRADDVQTWQVRTRSLHYGQLILHPHDPDDRRFVLVRGVVPAFTIVGWILGADGKRPEFWADPAGGRPAFFVPETALHRFAA